MMHGDQVHKELATSWVAHGIGNQLVKGERVLILVKTNPKVCPWFLKEKTTSKKHSFRNGGSQGELYKGFLRSCGS